MKIINNLPQLLDVQRQLDNIDYLLGSHDISNIGDGTVTGTIYSLKEELAKKSDTSHNHDETYMQKSSIINNNSITASGYALDARQANPNMSGSLGAQITSLNEAITRPKTSVDHDERYCTKAQINNKIDYVNSTTANQTFNNTAHSIDWKWSDTNNLCCFVDNILVFMVEGWTKLKRSW